MADSERGSDADLTAAPPPWARPFAVVLVATMVIAFTVPIPFALWPITSWELFSRARSGEQAGYDVEVVVGDAAPEPLGFRRLGPAHRRWLQAARRLPSEDADGKVAICRTWAEAAAEVYAPEGAVEVRVFRAVRRAADDPDVRPATVGRQLVVTCGARGDD